MYDKKATFECKQPYIIKEIIKILADNSLTIEEANKILYETTRELSRQTILTP